MSRSVDDIQSDIENTRNQLANTLDALSERTSPKNIAQSIGDSVKNALQNPKVQAGLVLVVACVGVGLAVRHNDKKKQKQQIEDMKQLIADARAVGYTPAGTDTANKENA